MNALTRSLNAFFTSSVGMKLLVALSGAFIVLFLAGHLAGNMLIYQSSEDFNHYAHFLHTMLHGWGIWIFRVMMLLALGVHVIFTIKLTRLNRIARPSRYQHDSTIQAPRSSRVMIVSGLTILAFFVFHILHYTVRIQPELKQLADFGQNWAMTVKGFQNLPVVVFYVISMALLCSHLSHGVASMFQTLGLRSKKTAPAIHAIAKLYATVIFFGFISIPLSVQLGYGASETAETIKQVEAAAASGLDSLPTSDADPH